MILTLAAAGIAALILSNNQRISEIFSRRLEPEITVRNSTDNLIRYRIKPYDSSDPAESKSLSSGELERFPTRVSLDITYLRLGREVTYQLLPGKNYSFRQDNNNLLQIYLGSHGLEDTIDLAPFVPTPMIVVEKMLEMAQMNEDDFLYDLGCGDGRIVIAAAEKYGTRGVGIDISPVRIEESREWAKKAGVEDLVRFFVGDATQTDISGATVVTLYLLPESNEILRPLMEAQLEPGARVVSHNYHIPGWEDRESASAELKDSTGKNHTIFLYYK